MRCEALSSAISRLPTYAAQRAQRQYDAADPENRLVADELERRWNQALEHVREIEQRIGQHSGAPKDTRSSWMSTRRRVRSCSSSIGDEAFTPKCACHAADALVEDHGGWRGPWT